VYSAGQYQNRCHRLSSDDGRRVPDRAEQCSVFPARRNSGSPTRPEPMGRAPRRDHRRPAGRSHQVVPVTACLNKASGIAARRPIPRGQRSYAISDRMMSWPVLSLCHIAAVRARMRWRPATTVALAALPSQWRYAAIATGLEGDAVGGVEQHLLELTRQVATPHQALAPRSRRIIAGSLTWCWW